jgi:hypothetical protein
VTEFACEFRALLIAKKKFNSGAKLAVSKGSGNFRSAGKGLEFHLGR